MTLSHYVHVCVSSVRNVWIKTKTLKFYFCCNCVLLRNRSALVCPLDNALTKQWLKKFNEWPRCPSGPAREREHTCRLHAKWKRRPSAATLLLLADSRPYPLFAYIASDVVYRPRKPEILRDFRESGNTLGNCAPVRENPQ